MNPACKHCGGQTGKSGFHRDGRRRYVCEACRRTTLEYYFEKPPRKPCPACGGRLHLAGKRHERQAYLCYTCGKFHIEGSSRAAEARKTLTRSSLFCIICHGLMIIRSVDRGQRRYTCKICRVTYSPCVDGARGRKSATTATDATSRQARQQQAARLDDGLLDVINAALPSCLPVDLRDDITQEMAVAALDGALDLADLASQVSIFRQRINRLSANRWQFVSLSQPIPNAGGLTYGDTIAG